MLKVPGSTPRSEPEGGPRRAGWNRNNKKFVPRVTLPRRAMSCSWIAPQGVEVMLKQFEPPEGVVLNSYRCSVDLTINSYRCSVATGWKKPNLNWRKPNKIFQILS